MILSTDSVPHHLVTAMFPGALGASVAEAKVPVAAGFTQEFSGLRAQPLRLAFDLPGVVVVRGGGLLVVGGLQLRHLVLESLDLLLVGA